MQKVHLIDEIKKMTDKYQYSSILWSYSNAKLEKILEELKNEPIDFKQKYGCDFEIIDKALEKGIVYEGVVLEGQSLCLQKIYEKKPPVLVFRKDDQYFEIDTKDYEINWVLNK